MKRKIKQIISLVLCNFILLSNGAVAYCMQYVDNSEKTSYTENTVFSDSLYLNEAVQIQTIGATIEVRPPFIIAPLHSEASFFSSIESWVFVYSNLTVEGYDGNYIKVKVRGDRKLWGVQQEVELTSIEEELILGSI